MEDIQDEHNRDEQHSKDGLLHGLDFIDLSHEDQLAIAAHFAPITLI